MGALSKIGKWLVVAEFSYFSRGPQVAPSALYPLPVPEYVHADPLPPEAPGYLRHRRRRAALQYRNVAETVRP